MGRWGKWQWDFGTFPPDLVKIGKNILIVVGIKKVTQIS